MINLPVDSTTVNHMVRMAMLCHESNRVLQKLFKEEVSKPWDESTDEDRLSTFEGVEKALFGKTSEELHESWRINKERRGWTFGEVKDSIAKTHPCMVDYKDLSDQDKAKDEMFYTVINTYLKGLE